MNTAKRLKISAEAESNSSGRSAEAVSRLRIVISDLIDELETLDLNSLSQTADWQSEHCGSISFYDEVKRFEISLIKVALRRTEGHQLRAARLLNLNPTTLNNKIKQYRINQSIRYKLL